AHPADAWHQRSSGKLWLHGEELLDGTALSVAGEHQVANALAVALAASALGRVTPTAKQIDRSTVAKFLPSFKGLPGRYALAGKSRAINFIEDSIATRPLAVAAALSSTPKPLVWLAGGHSKGADVSSLRTLVAERVDLLITYGASGPELAETFADLVRVEQCRHNGGAAALEAAVVRAVAFLEIEHGGRGNVLLAPLAASFDQFSDYADRARVFRAVVDTVIAARESRGR